MILTIGGMKSSGKSTLARFFAEKYDFKLISTAKILKPIARNNSAVIVEVRDYIAKNPGYIKTVKAEVQTLLEKSKGENLVIDSVFYPLFKDVDIRVGLMISPNEAVKRLNKNNPEHASFSLNTPSEKHLHTLDSYQKQEESVKQRSQEIFGIDIEDSDYYHLVFNTSQLQIEYIAEDIYNFLKDAKLL